MSEHPPERPADELPGLLEQQALAETADEPEYDAWVEAQEAAAEPEPAPSYAEALTAAAPEPAAEPEPAPPYGDAVTPEASGPDEGSWTAVADDPTVLDAAHAHVEPPAPPVPAEDEGHGPDDAAPEPEPDEAVLRDEPTASDELWTSSLADLEPAAEPSASGPVEPDLTFDAPHPGLPEATVDGAPPVEDLAAPAPPAAPEPEPTQDLPAEQPVSPPADAWDEAPAEDAPETAALAEPVHEADLQPVHEAEVQPELEAASAVAAPAVVRAGRGTLALAVALVLVLGALAAFLWVQQDRTRGGGPAERARSEAVAAARGAARVVFSYDYQHLSKDFAAGLALTTGEFRTEYQSSTSKVVSDFAPRYKAVVVADVSGAGVVEASADRAVVLVFVNQRSTSTLAATERITQSRLEMTMVKLRGHWLIQRIKAF